ncbi:V-type ATP synthase subunit I [Caproicibacter sp.]|uniref:V-type ATP synthase subunit I n=1 Tax=Caproicibacter sp. TaxID=2814884 RepID=UPI003988B4B1
MAVVKIKVLSVIGRMSELDDVTTALGKSGVFHPDNALAFYSDTSEFTPLNDENPYSDSLNTLEETLKSINKHVELLTPKAIDKIIPLLGDWHSYVKNFSSSVSEFLDQRNDMERQIATDSREMEKVGHFMGLDMDLDELRECKFIKFRFGSLPIDSYEKLSQYDNNPYMVFFPSTKEEEHYWGMYCAPIEQIAEVDRIFSGLYFERTHLQKLDGTMETAMGQLAEKLRDENRQKEELNRRINDLWEKEKQKVQNVFSWLSEDYVFFNIRRYAARYRDNFIITGWVPADKENTIKASLDQMETVKYTFDRAEEPEVLMHSPPVKLKNKKLFRPFEYFVSMYGLPGYNEVDPTFLVAMTYVLFFGIMFADFGQGLCVSLVGWYLWKKRKMPLGKALVPCGISSAFFGFLFGTAFGFENAFDPIYQSVFGLPEKPISVLEPSDTNAIIYTTIGLGILLVVIAILINIYSSLRRKRYASGLFGPNGVAGLIFYCAVIFGIVGQLVMQIHVFSTLYVICLIVLPMLSMMLQEVLGGMMEGRPDWKPENITEFTIQNLFEVFDYMLNYLSNTVSFIRVGAFVLVHAGMMMVVFTLAEMTSGLGFALIVIIGNLFVMALEGLLVGIQALRLEFYEMFSRFFDGDGRPFTPVIVRQES